MTKIVFALVVIILSILAVMAGAVTSWLAVCNGYFLYCAYLIGAKEKPPCDGDRN